MICPTISVAISIIGPSCQGQSSHASISLATLSARRRAPSCLSFTALGHSSPRPHTFFQSPSQISVTITPWPIFTCFDFARNTLRPPPRAIVPLLHGSRPIFTSPAHIFSVAISNIGRHHAMANLHMLRICCHHSLPSSSLSGRCIADDVIWHFRRLLFKQYYITG